MLENLDNRSEEFCLMGNFLVSEGKPGKVHAYYIILNKTTRLCLFCAFQYRTSVIQSHYSCASFS